MPASNEAHAHLGCSLSQSGAPASLLAEFCLCLLQPRNVPGSRGCDGQPPALIPAQLLSADIAESAVNNGFHHELVS